MPKRLSTRSKLTKRSLQESSQKTISLKDDEADAVEEVIRSIYGCTLGVSNTRPWKYWFDLVIIADKYLEPQPSKDAATNLRVSASIETDADVIVDVISAIKREMSHMDSLLEFADKLRKNNLAKLLRNERYRALLDGDKALMWSQFDELRDTNEDLGVTGLSEKEYFSCPSHTWLLMIRSPAGVLKCPLCKKTELNRRTIWNRE